MNVKYPYYKSNKVAYYDKSDNQTVMYSNLQMIISDYLNEVLHYTFSVVSSKSYFKNHSHDFENVLYNVYLYPETFEVPDIFLFEYSKQELNIIQKFKQQLLEDGLKDIVKDYKNVKEEFLKRGIRYQKKCWVTKDEYQAESIINNILQPIVFNKKVINEQREKINKNLIAYVEKNILKEYKKNDKGHDLNHINYVLNKALEISREYNIDLNILYVSVIFHDIACHIDREKHEMLSAEIAIKDNFINSLFNKEDIIVIKEAIEDHRASLKTTPRNIYGKILSSSDRKVEVKEYLKSSMSFDINNNPALSKEEIIESSYKFAIKKFGKDGYAINKTYVDDMFYQLFIYNLNYLINNKDFYFLAASKVYDEIIS